MIDNYIENNKTSQVLKLDSQGRVKQVIYSCVGCPSHFIGLLVLGDHLYIFHYNGTVLETRVSDGQVLMVSTIPDVSSVVHQGSLYSKPDKIPDKDTLLLCDLIKGEVFTFKRTGQKKVRITGLVKFRSVSYFFLNQAVFYIVCEGGRHRINVYNQTWDLIRTIGRYGSNDGELYYPQGAIVSDEDTIMISDMLNNRVSEFSVNGTFLRHLLVTSGSDIFYTPSSIYRPFSISYYYPYLWLVNDGFHRGKLYRYNLYR